MAWLRRALLLALPGTRNCLDYRPDPVELRPDSHANKETPNRMAAVSELTRRDFLRRTAVAAGGLTLGVRSMAAENASAGSIGSVHIAPFRFDVTPPVGHSLCGGWIKPVVGVDDPLEAIGFVILGAGAPIVVCAVDWTGILNEAHVAWRGAG